MLNKGHAANIACACSVQTDLTTLCISLVRPSNPLCRHACFLQITWLCDDGTTAALWPSHLMQLGISSSSSGVPAWLPRPRSLTSCQNTVSACVMHGACARYGIGLHAYKRDITLSCQAGYMNDKNRRQLKRMQVFAAPTVSKSPHLDALQELLGDPHLLKRCKEVCGICPCWLVSAIVLAADALACILACRGCMQS